MYHAHVAIAEFLMNFRTHLICLLCTDSDNVFLQLETHVSNVPLLLYSQLTGFELLTNGVERLAGILEDVLDSAFDVFEVLNLLL